MYTHHVWEVDIEDIHLSVGVPKQEDGVDDEDWVGQPAQRQEASVAQDRRHET